MKYNRKILVRNGILFLISLCLLTPAWAGHSGKIPPPSKGTPTPFAPNDIILVKLKAPHGNKARLSASLRANGLRIDKEIRSVPGLKILRSTGNQTSAAASIKGRQRRIEALKETGLFDYVEPDWKVSVLQTLPTDTSFTNGDLWGLRNTGQNGGVAGVDVNAVAAWSLTTGTPTTIVGVIDTGIRTTHQDIVGNLWVNPAEIPANGIDDDANGYIDDIHGINAITATGDPTDDHDHGTHVSGTIAATAFDSGGHVGVAYNVKLMGLKFLDSTGNGTISGAIACIDYAITNGATILNNSWGGSGFSQALKDAIEAANSAGILFIAAAGNDGSNNDVTAIYPASFDVPNVVSVAAIDRTGALAYFSNYGTQSVDLGAPGVAILSSTSGSDSSYAYFDGTSMATPHVAGVAALLVSHFPSADIFELKARLLQSTTPLTSLNGLTATGGMVNAEGALLISEDGDMEFQANTPNGALVADEDNIISILVTDFLPVTGATVSAFLEGDAPTPFLDDGVAPDLVAGDSTYTASLFVEGGPSTINLEISATATGKNPSSDIVSFSIITPPPNDDFADRVVVSNSETTITGTNRLATLETGEPVNPSVAGGHSVWWEWVPLTSGSVTVSTGGSTFDTTLAIYQGTTLSSLTLIGSDDDSLGVQSAVGFNATAGESYLIQVNGYDNAIGSVRLNYGDFTVGPPNDDFVDRLVLASGTTQTTGNNFQASAEPGEPYFSFYLPFESVWWEWVAPSSSPATITTFGSSFDTVLVVYEGSELTSLTQVAANDDSSGLQSSVTFTPTPGRSYKIQVYGNSLATPTIGTIVLNYPNPAPPATPNDHFAQRILLDPGTTQTTGSNAGATLETNEPVNPETAGASSVWWEWLAPLSGNVTIDTIGSAFNTTLAVYTGEQLDALLLISANDDSSGLQSEVTFLATQGVSYKIQINGFSGDSGSIKLNYPEPALPRPLNDDLEDRIYLALGTTQTSGNNSSATIEPYEPLNPAGSGSKTVWWNWVSPSSNPATITTVGSDFDTTLAIYTGTSLDNLTLLVDNNDDTGTQSSVTFTPVAGSSYLIQVNGYSSSNGSIILNYPAPGIPRPPNDNFDNRIVLAPGTIRTSGSNENATSEPSEPVHPTDAGSQSVWWEWIAPSSGPVTIETVDSNFDTTMAIYTGTDLATLSLVGDNDDYVSFYSGVSFDALAGLSYLIQVTGNAGATGEIYLNYPMPFPVSVDPGRLRLAGSPGGNADTALTILNGSGTVVDFSISSPSDWITAVPSSGTIPPGIEVAVALEIGPLPAFSGAVYSSITIDLTHPSLSSIEIPIEIIDQSIVVDIPDPNLRTALEQHLGRLPDEPIADVEMSILTTLDARDRNIASLLGLEYAVNLFYLYLDDNQITDLSPLSGLSNLFIIDLSGNNLSDISILGTLPILLNLDVTLNYLDINPGSDDRAVIDALISSLATVAYDPQKGGMLTLTDWAVQWDVHPSNRKVDDVNGPLGITNILAFMMGLDPFSATSADMPVAYRIPDSNLFTFTYYRDAKAQGILTSHMCSVDLDQWDVVTPILINVLWDDGNGHQQVEAVFEEPSEKMFFILDVNAY